MRNHLIRHRPRRSGPRRSRPRRLPDLHRRGPRGGAGGRVPFSRPTGKRASRRKRTHPTMSSELIFTCRTTGTPKGVMLTHDNVVASIEAAHHVVPPLEHRVVSRAAALAPARAGGRRSTTRSPSAPTSSTSAAATHGSSSRRSASIGSRRWSSCPRCSTSSGARSSARSTSPAGARTVDRLRRIARHLPYRSGASSSGASIASSAARSASSCAPAPSCRRRSSRRGRISASSVVQGYGATENGPGAARPPRITGWGRSAGRSAGHPGAPRRRDGEILSAARRCSRATGATPRRRPRR